MIKKAVEKITKLKTWSKEKGFKNLLPWEESKLKQVQVKEPLLTGTQIFEKSGIKGVKKDKRSRILWELRSVKKKKISYTTSSHESKYFKAFKFGREN